MSERPIIIPTQDGVWMARCPRTGAHATGSTREDAVRRLAEARGR